MADRLTRRERAAMRLALEVLRFDVRYRSAPRSALEAETDVHQAANALRIGDAYELVDAAWRQVNCYPLTAPLVRARLALYLRARLRADRGDTGARERRVCGRCGHWHIRWELTGRGRSRRRIEYCGRCSCQWFRLVPCGPPLWDQAPAHGTWRHGCWRTGIVIDVPRGEPCDECGTRSPAHEEDR